MRVFSGSVVSSHLVMRFDFWLQSPLYHDR